MEIFESLSHSRSTFWIFQDFFKENFGRNFFSKLEKNSKKNLSHHPAKFVQHLRAQHNSIAKPVNLFFSPLLRKILKQKRPQTQFLSKKISHSSHSSLLI